MVLRNDIHKLSIDLLLCTWDNLIIVSYLDIL